MTKPLHLEYEEALWFDGFTFERRNGGLLTVTPWHFIKGTRVQNGRHGVMTEEAAIASLDAAFADLHNPPKIYSHLAAKGH